MIFHEGTAIAWKMVKNHIFLKHGEKHVNGTIIDDPLSWNEAIRCNMKKLMGNARNSLYRIDTLRNSIVL